LKYIDTTLKKRDKCHGKFNKVVRSPTVPNEYGVVARIFTPAGTFLGFYKGKVIVGVEDDFRDHSYTFKIGRNEFIDASDYLSCFARYYNCSLKSGHQNVCVEILTDWTNPQKAICFIANKDIQKGEEFLISYGPEYWEAKGANLPAHSKLKQVCDILSGASCALESVEPLFSVEAPFLAAEFGDDKSETSEDTDSDYCE
jgi:SET domain-containing protein